jgi:S1-C subfamily serine protease
MIVGMFVVGMVGGIFADQIFWPYFIERPLFYQYRLEQSPVYVTEKKEIVVRENTALEMAAEKVKNTIIGVRTKTNTGEVLEGTGLIVTSDGLMVTLAELVPRGSNFYFYYDGSWLAYQILKRDLKNNLALVKIEKTGLSTVGFANPEEIKPGERVFLVGERFFLSGTTTSLSASIWVNEGIVSSFGDGELIQTNILEKDNMAGSPLFDIKGKVVGLAIINENGQVSAIPVSTIRQFAGF